jgi:hypothetical protein
MQIRLLKRRKLEYHRYIAQETAICHNGPLQNFEGERKNVIDFEQTDN